jgi:type I restriction enzyme S subunit
MNTYVRPGYKQTEVGVIPEGWEVNRLADISERITVGIASAATHAYRKKGIPLLRNQNIKSGYLDERDVLYIAPDYEVAFQNKRLCGGDLLTARTGYPGTTCVVPNKYDSAQSFTTLITRPRPKVIDSTYLCHYINSEYGQKFFEQTQIGGAQKNVNAGALREMPVPVPLRDEQRAIATALSDVDALLAKLDAFIGKKRDLKQAAMQQLLTGRTRLTGFGGEWDRFYLGDLFTFKNGLNKARQFFGFGTPIVNYMDVFSNAGIQCSKLQGLVSLSVQEIKNFDVKKGDVLFTRTSETPDEIGMASVVLDEPRQTVFSGFVLRGRPRNDRLCDVFKAYCFQSSFVRRQIISKASYTTRALTNGRLLSGVLLPVPSLSEQAAIATVLSDMDADLAVLEARRDKTRALKQGMMQELLTGRIRLV